MSGRLRSYDGRLVTDSNGDMTLFIFFGGSDETGRTETGAEGESNIGPDEVRVVLVNPLRQSFIFLEGVSSFEALFGDLQSKAGLPPASKASIEALPEVEIGDDEQDLNCAICLDEIKVAKMMPCKHMFHGACVEKWLRTHGSCPVCRFQMPVEEHSPRKRVDEVDNNDVTGTGRVEREIWIPFPIRNVSVENSILRSNQETEQQQESD